jgi:hypothetical protein
MTTTAMPALAHLGPATVSACPQDGRVLAVIDGEERALTLAMAVRYVPEPGDVLLVAADERAAWAIGVISGRGALRLESARAIEIDSPRTTLRGATVELLAERLLTRARSALHQVMDLLHVRAGRSHREVEGSSLEEAGQVGIRAKGPVMIDGTTIHLG